MFIDEELEGIEESLDEIANKGSLEKDVFELIRWAKSKGHIDELYSELCQCNADNPRIADLQREIGGTNLISGEDDKIPDEAWQILYGIFASRNRPEVSRAFLDSFELSVGRPFHRVYPEKDSFNLQQIYQTLEDLDDPKLTAAFANGALTRMKAENNATDDQITQLSQWRDLLLSIGDLTLADIQPPDTTIKQGYLLVSLQEHPKRTQKEGVYVTVYAELHIVGQAKPTPMGNAPLTCPLSSVAEHLCHLIESAEQVIENGVTLELFLPCVHLEHDVSDWRLKKHGKDVGILGLHQPYLIRSYERAKNKVSQTRIKAKWHHLINCVEASDPCKQFHTQSVSPKWGELVAYLGSATGLLLTAEFSADITQRRRIMSDIVNAAVPIALWFSDVEASSEMERQAAFEMLLQAGCVSNFVELAQHWQRHRASSDGKPERHLKLLCDCPHRWPHLPDIEQDSLVSIG